jgi:hypothetical protein
MPFTSPVEDLTPSHKYTIDLTETDAMFCETNNIPAEQFMLAIV